MKGELISAFLSQILYEKRRHHPKATLFAGLSGCQGSGKSTISSFLVDHLASCHQLSCVVLSLDDFYLDHATLTGQSWLQSKAAKDNPLLQGRGNPGTHDLQLLCSTLSMLLETTLIPSPDVVFQQLRARHSDLLPTSEAKDNIPIRKNSDGTEVLVWPKYDKSKYQGKGDRLPYNQWWAIPWKSASTQPQVDIIILEGWMVGFQPVPPNCILEMVQSSRSIPAYNSNLNVTLEHWEYLNCLLVDYQWLWEWMDALVVLNPDVPVHQRVWQWRLQQEHDLRNKTNGVGGMSDEEVQLFVAKFLPAYHLCFSELTQLNPLTPKDNPTKTTLQKLVLLLDQERHLLSWKCNLPNFHPSSPSTTHVSL